MTTDNATGAPDPSHDDVSNPGPTPPNAPVVDNDAHDRNDDGPGAPDPEVERREPLPNPKEKIVEKPISDMAPPGQDGPEGVE